MTEMTKHRSWARAEIPILFVSGVLLHFFQSSGARLNSGFVDPNLYSGLGFSYRDVSEIVGPTYYATRVTFLSPLIVFSYLFGVNGPIVFLHVLRGAYVASIGALLRGLMPNQFVLRYGLSLFLACLPSILFEASWTDEGGVFTLMMTLLLLVAHRSLVNPRLGFVCGMLAMFAVNIHLKGVALVLTVLFSAAFVGRTNAPLRRIFARWGLGAGLSLLGLEIVYQILNLRISPGFSWSYQIRLLLRLGEVGNSEWTPTFAALGDSNLRIPWYYLVIVFGGLYFATRLLLSHRTALTNDERFLGWVSILGAGSTIYYQEFLRFPVTSTFWYFSTFHIVQVAMLGGMLIAGVGESRRVGRFVGVLLLILPILSVTVPNDVARSVRSWSYLLVEKPLPWNGWLVGTTVVFGILVYVTEQSIRTTRRLALPVAILFAVAALSQYDDPNPLFRARAIGDFSNEQDIFRDQRWLIDKWSHLEEGDERQNVAFWYIADAAGYLGSVQSATIFDRTRLTLANTLFDGVDELWNQDKGDLTTVLALAVDKSTLMELELSLRDLGCQTQETERSPTNRIHLATMSC